MEYKLQSKLLRVLEEKTFERIGGIKPVRFRARIIASTNQGFEESDPIGRLPFRSVFQVKGPGDIPSAFKRKT